MGQLNTYNLIHNNDNFDMGYVDVILLILLALTMEDTRYSARKF